MQRFFIILFYIFAIIGISLFVLSYIQSMKTVRTLHLNFYTGLEKSKECGFEYMEKESGLTHLYIALQNPQNPLQASIETSLKSLLTSISVFSICVLIVVLYYFAKQPANEQGVSESNFFDTWKDASKGWLPLLKVGIYLRYLLIPSIFIVLLFFYYKTSNQLYLPNYNEKKDDTVDSERSADPDLQKKKEETVARDVESTQKRQLLTLGGLAARMFIMKLFFVPDIPISPILLSITDVSLVLSLLLLMIITKFNGQIQEIYRERYMPQVKSLNESVSSLMSSPVFMNHYLQNAKRMSKDSPEKFMPHHISQLAEDGTLYWYLVHHVSSNSELEFMKKEARSKMTGAKNKKITWSPVVNRIRADMNTLRQAQSEMDAIFKKNMLYLVAIFTLPLLLVIYILFHNSFKTNPQNTVLYVIGAILLCILYLIIRNIVSYISVQQSVATSL